eukprot:TRINITY_DN15284_c0_g1_i1.p1 TRINITY_DN15284_c0_g1~~TRINITY_DN15284_c0_g1_i1.p1  ORF type:complete len:201 (+),score=0.27 TRINITY_DN15284_c0_g1_i1:171-773(+)
MVETAEVPKKEVHPPAESALPNATMVAVDGSVWGSYAFRHAACHTNQKDRLHIVTAVHKRFATIGQNTDLIKEENGKAREDAIKMLDRYRQQCIQTNRTCTFNVIEFEGASSDLAESLCREALRSNSTHLVTGSHGKNTIQRAFLGSTSSYCVNHCPMTVTVVKSDHVREAAYSYMMKHPDDSKFSYPNPDVVISVCLSE